MFFLIICYIRLLGWWSIDEGSREEQARLYQEGASRCVYGIDINIAHQPLNINLHFSLCVLFYDTYPLRPQTHYRGG